LASYDVTIVISHVSAPVNALAAALIIVVSVWQVLIRIEEWLGHLSLIVLFIVCIAIRVIFFVVLGEQH
jgi:hypothetical protein